MRFLPLAIVFAAVLALTAPALATNVNNCVTVAYYDEDELSPGDIFTNTVKWSEVGGLRTDLPVAVLWVQYQQSDSSLGQTIVSGFEEYSLTQHIVGIREGICVGRGANAPKTGRRICFDEGQPSGSDVDVQASTAPSGLESTMLRGSVGLFGLSYQIPDAQYNQIVDDATALGTNSCT